MDKYLVTPDTSVYKLAATIEGAFWGQVVWNPDAPSSAQLPIAAYENRIIGGVDSGKLWAWLENIIPKLGPINRALSLGAGIGAFETELFGRGIIKHLELVDISEGACKTAKEYLISKFGESAADRISVKVQDLNFTNLPKNHYDLIIAMGIIHHLINLEHIFEHIHHSLTVGGKILMHEMIGASHYQFPDKTLAAIKEWQDRTPDLPYKINPQRIPWGGGYCSPFECVRSEELFPIIKDHFPGKPVIEVKYGGIYFPYLLLSEGKWRKLPQEQKNSLLEKLVSFDEEMSKAEKVQPMRLFAIYAKEDTKTPEYKITPWTSKELWERIDERSQLSFMNRIKYEIKRNPLFKKIRG